MRCAGTESMTPFTALHSESPLDRNHAATNLFPRSATPTRPSMSDETQLSVGIVLACALLLIAKRTGFDVQEFIEVAQSRRSITEDSE